MPRWFVGFKGAAVHPRTSTRPGTRLDSDQMIGREAVPADHSLGHFGSAQGSAPKRSIWIVDGTRTSPDRAQLGHVPQWATAFASAEPDQVGTASREETKVPTI